MGYLNGLFRLGHAVWRWAPQLASRRIHKGYFRDDFPKVIPALGYLWGGGQIKFYIIVESSPGDNSKPSSRPILDPRGRKYPSSVAVL